MCYVQEDDPVLANGLPKVALEVVVVQPHEPSRAGQANRGTQNKQEDKETLHLDANGNVGVEKGLNNKLVLGAAEWSAQQVREGLSCCTCLEVPRQHAQENQRENTFLLRLHLVSSNQSHPVRHFKIDRLIGGDHTQASATGQDGKKSNVRREQEAANHVAESEEALGTAEASVESVPPIHDERVQATRGARPRFAVGTGARRI